MRTKEETHKRFCDYEIAKASNNRYISRFSQRKSKSVVTGIKTSGKSKAILAMELASLF